VIRIFGHYLRRETLLKMLFDVGLLLLVMAGIDVVQKRVAGTFSIVSMNGLSLTAGLLLVNSASGLYQPSANRSLSHSCARAAIALLIGLPLAYGILSVLTLGTNAEAPMLSAAMAAVAAVIVHRVCANHVSSASRPRSRIMIFGSGTAADMVARTLTTPALHAEIVGYFPGPNEGQPVVPPQQVLTEQGSLRECAVRLGVDEIVVALTERRGGSMPLRDLLDCKVCGIRVSDMSTHFEKTLGQIRIDYVNAGWLIFGDGFNRGIYPVVVKRLFDVLGALILLTLAAPLMLATICLIKLESRGPIFYRQERIGQNGKSFSVLKFRSMRTDAEQDGKPRWASADDDRTTRVGRFIRTYRIDEIPQLLNVFKGEMSLVGPRPERSFFVEQLTREIPYYSVRHSVKPGITGWAQIKYQYGATLKDSIEKLQFDLYYVKNSTLFLDLVILFQTVAVVVSGKGAR
jgi:sugar transferase (PEP-CTERM system associated)